MSTSPCWMCVQLQKVCCFSNGVLSLQPEYTQDKMSWLSVGFSFTREVRKWFLMTWLTYNNGCMLFNILDNPGNIYFQKMMSFWTLFLQLFPGCFFLSRWLLLGWSLLPTLPNCILNSFYFVIHLFQLCTLTCTALLFILHSLEWWNLIFGVHAKVLSFINNFFI